MTPAIRFMNPKRKPLPIPAGAAQALEAFGVHINPWESVQFSLRRRKKGAEVWFHIGGFTWNHSAMAGRYPRTFADARRLVAMIAATHGQEITEKVKPRSPRMRGADRKLLRDGIVPESWLQSDVPSLWAEAQMLCRSAKADCGRLGFCEIGGCFAPTPPEEGR